MKDNITVVERMAFVDMVIDMCKIDDKYEPALFDFAFRVAVLVYFNGETERDLKKLNEKVYSDEMEEYIGNMKPVIHSLYQASKEKIKMEQQREMAVYAEALRRTNDPWIKMAETFENLAKQFNMEDIIKEIAAENAKRPIVVGDPEKAKAEREKRETAKRKITRKKAQDVGLKVLANPEMIDNAKV